MDNDKIHTEVAQRIQTIPFNLTRQEFPRAETNMFVPEVFGGILCVDFAYTNNTIYSTFHNGSNLVMAEFSGRCIFEECSVENKVNIALTQVTYDIRIIFMIIAECICTELICGKSNIAVRVSMADSGKTALELRSGIPVSVVKYHILFFTALTENMSQPAQALNKVLKNFFILLIIY